MKLRIFIILFPIITAFNSEFYLDTSRYNQKHLLNVINELNDQLDIEWNMIISLEVDQEIEDLLKQTQVPKLLISKLNENHKEIYKLFKHQVMTIVFGKC